MLHTLGENTDCLWSNKWLLVEGCLARPRDGWLAFASSLLLSSSKVLTGNLDENHADSLENVGKA